MNRNSSTHFSVTDNTINTGRSKFDRSSWFKGTFNCSDLIPCYLDEILPGDSFQMNMSVLARMATPLFPVMDNATLDTYFFFVPNRLVFDHWAELNGENDVNAWAQVIDYQVPQVSLYYDDGFFTTADYFGLPVTNEGSGNDIPISVSALPFRAYQLIWNEWFRDQNLQNPVLINKGDSVSLAEKQELLKIRKVCKFHDYFTSALPAPQKGPAVLIPGLEGLQVGNIDGAPGATYVRYLSNDGTIGQRVFNNSLQTNSSGQLVGDDQLRVTFSNLGIVSDGSTTGATIDSLRTAFQIQKLLWRDGNGGTRYTEILRSHFGVVSPDSRLQRPEYLGGKRIPLTMNQVIQQSAGTDDSPLGNTGAYSKTVDSFNGFTKSFTEHGYIIGLCCVRYDHTYQQGINKLWTRKNRFDFYYPELANIGEQPILNKEIYASFDGIDNKNDEVFGYQEAWAEYRYRPSYVTGSFRTNAPGGSLDVWHYADYYDSLPTLSAGWIEEDYKNVDRTLALQMDTDGDGIADRHEQILLDAYFDLKCTRPMPVYSVPGLVDHF